RGLEEIALITNPLAAGDKLPAALGCVSDHTLECRNAPVIGKRAHDSIRLEPVAHLDRFRRSAEAGHEVARHIVLHQEARRRYADLARIAELVGRKLRDRLFDIGVTGDDHWRMAAKLHRGALHVLAGK